MKKFFYIIILITFALYFTISFTIGNNSLTTLKSYVSSENKFLIKKFFFPYNYISKLENEILRNKSRGTISELFFAVIKELDFKESLKDFKTEKKKEVKLSNGKTLVKYRLLNFHAGINHTIPGTGYIDFYNDNIFILSARGILGYSKNIENE